MLTSAPNRYIKYSSVRKGLVISMVLDVPRNCDSFDVITTFGFFANPFADEIATHYPAYERINLLLQGFRESTIFEWQVKFDEIVYQAQMLNLASRVYAVRGYRGLGDELLAKRKRKR